MRQDDEAFAKYPQFETMVRGILGQERNSAMKLSSAKRILATRDAYKRQNEATFTSNMVPLIVKASRSGKPPSQTTAIPTPAESQLTEAIDVSTPADDQDAVAETINNLSKYFLTDGIITFLNQDFARTLLPRGDDKTTEKQLAKALEKSPGMTNPRPDYVFGFSPKQFSLPFDTSSFSEVSALLDVVNGMNFAYLIIEAKSDGGSLATAENQACRGGATLINAHRQLIAKTRVNGQGEKVGPDEKTFVFSCTMGPSTMVIWVHWAEVREEDTTIFHMNHLTGHYLGNTQSLLTLRQQLHNILDWGLEVRMSELKALQPGLHAFERERRRTQSQSPAKKARLSPSKTPSVCSKRPYEDSDP